MLDLKSLITLSILLFSYPPSFASASPEPQWWAGGNPNGNGQQQGQPAGGWSQAQPQQGAQWGRPNQAPQAQQGPQLGRPDQTNNPNQNNAPYEQVPRPANPGYPQQNAQPGNNPYQNAQVPQPTPATPPQPTTPRDQDPPDNDGPSGPRWTPPPSWGPRTIPFGPKPPQDPPTTTPPPPLPVPVPNQPNQPPKPKPAGTRPDYCTNPDLICTTANNEHKEPIPYAVTCGKSRFNQFDVSNALSTGCYWFKKNSTISGTEFPKVFDNSKGRFDFGKLKGPFFEFPLIDSAAYVSGPPGDHRVIFSTPDCFLAGEITSEGQSKGVYTECTEEF
ncbi:putative extracellular guanyl-specific ribonuclease T1 [Venturia nashicola]|uniref:ribonuclease T1 n=1 Tax=Venturia nashicola TaxID=86259 RepID=A0A4Z1P956_9PEZI|nr:putative extracellular guanyl-specific ribonuclease T1 [Venturia nashicola]